LSQLGYQNFPQGGFRKSPHGPLIATNYSTLRHKLSSVWSKDRTPQEDTHVAPSTYFRLIMTLTATLFTVDMADGMANKGSQSAL
jgi:hypothetical protein